MNSDRCGSDDRADTSRRLAQRDNVRSIGRWWWPLVAATGLALLSAETAAAQTCSTTSLPYTLSNGTTADATQVMADLNCAAMYGLAHTTGNIGIGTTTTGAMLDVSGTARVYGQLQISGGSSVSWPLFGFNAFYNGNGSGGFINSYTGYSGSIEVTQDNGRFDFALGTGSQPGGANFGLVERLSILENGYVGIGTTSPQNALHVAGGITTTAGSSAPQAAGPAFSVFYDTSNNIARLYSVYAAVAWENMMFEANSFSFISGPSAQGLYQNTSGYVGIGTTSPSYPLYVYGTAYASGAAGALSDIRHKDHVVSLPAGALHTVEQLRPVTFTWKKPRDDGMKGEQIGLIAQEVEKILPAVVLTEHNAEGTKGIKYTELIPVLIKAIQEQQAEIGQQQSQIKQQQGEIEHLQSSVAQLARK